VKSQAQAVNLFPPESGAAEVFDTRVASSSRANYTAVIRNFLLIDELGELVQIGRPRRPRWAQYSIP